MNQQRQILVTSALPYANGPIHLGHLVEYIQTDIWVRFQKALGNTITYVCADDAHGTPIMLRAETLGITPETLINEVHASHQADFAGFLINFDNFYSTHSPENQAFCNHIYLTLDQKGYISQQDIVQAFDPVKQMFLPDRFVKGTCPKCHAPDQYGDNCENCGATYSPTDLIDPKSVLSNETPIEKSATHYFFELAQFESFLKTWLNDANIQPEIRNKLEEWFEAGLNPWDISRNAPYWGFKIPNTEDKYFYVWLDAPIGYMASFKNYCDSDKNTRGLKFDDYFNKDSQTELYHFIGKDIAYFHALFWPAMLKGADYRAPSGVFCHGFLTVNGAKMSKSRGTFIQASTYLAHLAPEYLRYYFATKLTRHVTDIDLNFEDFKQKNNSDLVGKLVNLASRNAGFIEKQFVGQLSESLDNPGLFEKAAQVIRNEVITAYETRDYATAVRHVIQLLDEANAYIDQEKPWLLAKDTSQHEKLQQVATTGLNLFYQAMIALSPVLPEVAENAKAFLNAPVFSFAEVNRPLLGQKINPFKPLLKRIEDKSIEAIIEASRSSLAPEKDKEKSHKQKGKAMTENKETSVISIDDFAKLDLRVAKVLACESIEEADKLLKFQLDVGPLGTRQVFSGIKKYYPDPSALVGKQVILVANLAPRKMRFGISEGMILSSENAEGLFLLPADPAATPGDSVK